MTGDLLVPFLAPGAPVFMVLLVAGWWYLLSAHTDAHSAHTAHIDSLPALVGAWLLTFPTAAAAGAATYGVTRIFGTGALGPVIVSAVALVVEGMVEARQQHEDRFTRGIGSAGIRGSCDARARLLRKEENVLVRRL